MMALLVLAAACHVLVLGQDAPPAETTTTTEAATTTATQEATTVTSATEAYSETNPPIVNVTVPPVSPYLKPGPSYNGTSAERILMTANRSVAVAVTLDNWSRWALVDPVVSMSCGRLVDSPGLRDIVVPGFSEVVLFQKDSGITGVCGVLVYELELEPEEPPQRITVMFSVPYNLNAYGAYFAVGVAGEKEAGQTTAATTTEAAATTKARSRPRSRSTTPSVSTTPAPSFNASDLFRDMYYYSGPFKRAVAGQLAEYAGSKIRIRGTMQPDTYTPILGVVVSPVKQEDAFTPGYYQSPRGRSGAPAINQHSAPPSVAAALLVLLLLKVFS